MTNSLERPPAIRFTDLADPVFPAEAQPIRDGLGAYGATLDLDPEAMLAAARDRTGLDDFGDPAFRPRLDVLSRSLREQSELSDAGTALAFEQVVGHLVNRLRLEALIREHPEIDDVVIDRPIIIAGLPRTGTTHLHNLIAADPALRYLPYWESLEPFPVPGEDEQGRRDRCSAGLDIVNTVMPDFKRMHEMTVDHAHEEIQILGNDLSTMLFETTFHLPDYAAHYKSEDQTGPYTYLKRSLKAMQWLRGGQRWVLKSPQHLEQFGVLYRTFPDATVVVTHRDPVEVIQSMCTMVSYATRMNCARPDPVKTSRYWLDRGSDLLNSCLKDRELLPADQSIDVRFEDFMADEQGTVATIYELADQPYDDRARAAMAEFCVAHPRGRHGDVLYEPGDLGLDRDEIAARLGEYRERFIG